VRLRTRAISGFPPRLVSPYVGCYLRRTGSTNHCVLFIFLLFIVYILSIVFYIGTMLEHRIPHLLPARRNFSGTLTFFINLHTEILMLSSRYNI
jgi:hypothetical protein